MPLRSYIRLTKRSVDSLRVEDADRVFWDRDLAGFGVRVYASGHKVYVVQSRGVEGSRRATLAHTERCPQRRQETGGGGHRADQAG